MFKNSTKIAIVHDWLDVYARGRKGSRVPVKHVPKC